MKTPLILSVETSGTQGSIALFKEVTLSQVNFSFRVKSYSTVIFPFLKKLLETTKISLKDIDYYALNIGPGSFTGLKIACALIKGLCLKYNKPIIKVSSLEALAYFFPFFSYSILSLVDAYTKEVFLAMYKWEKNKLKTLISPVCITFKKLSEVINKDEPILVVSETIEKWKEELKEMLGKNILFPPYVVELNASHIAKIAWHKLQQEEAAFETPETLKPFYLKASEAERKKNVNISS